MRWRLCSGSSSASSFLREIRRSLKRKASKTAVCQTNRKPAQGSFIHCCPLYQHSPNILEDTPSTILQKP